MERFRELKGLSQPAWAAWIEILLVRIESDQPPRTQQVRGGFFYVTYASTLGRLSSSTTSPNSFAS